MSILAIVLLIQFCEHDILWFRIECKIKDIKNNPKKSKNWLEIDYTKIELNSKEPLIFSLYAKDGSFNHKIETPSIFDSLIVF